MCLYSEEGTKNKARGCFYCPFIGLIHQANLDLQYKCNFSFVSMQKECPF